MKKQIWLVCGVLLLAAMACSFGGGAAQAPAATESNVLFQDDFSSTSSGWERSVFDGGEVDYLDGAYHIRVDDEYASVWALTGGDYGDVRVETDAVMAGGVDDNEFGVICRYQDDNNFYAGSVSSDGFYAIIAIVDGDFTYLGNDAMMPSDAIKLGSEVNRVRLDCVGPQITLYANGTQLLSVTDSSFAQGDVGLYAGTFATPGIDIAFDNFLARRP